MKIDITLKITPEMAKEAAVLKNKNLAGHLGTHFDVINKEFPLDYAERKGLIFDVRNIYVAGEYTNRDIDISDIAIEKVEKDMFVIFYSGYGEIEEYGTRKYYKEHPQLTNELIYALLDKGVSVIGLDFAGIRRGAEHTPMDQYCADRDVFIIENLCNINVLAAAQAEAQSDIIIHTYPMNLTDITGLPCRVVAEI